MMLATLANSSLGPSSSIWWGTHGLCGFKQPLGHKRVSAQYPMCLQALRLDICRSLACLPRCLQILRHIILQLRISLLYSNIHHIETELQAAAGMLRMPPGYYTVDLGTERVSLVSFRFRAELFNTSPALIARRLWVQRLS
jgi:hypothetical protein